jgi:hypothetical protein
MGKLLVMKFVKILIIYFLVFNFAYANWDWRGHQRALLTQTSGVSPDDDWEYSSSQAVINHRSIVLYQKKQHSAEFAYELFPIYQHLSHSSFILASTPVFKYRVDDLKYYLLKSSQFERSSASVMQNLDRLYYTFSPDWIELSIGRQPIAFGSARTINPLDILVPLDFITVNFEQRTGVDGLRAKIPFSEMGLIDFGVVLDQNITSENEYKFISIVETIKSYDIRLIYQNIFEYGIYGLDIQTSLWDWGIWLECAYYDLEQSDHFLRATVGGQYLFRGDISFFMEYHYNQFDEQNTQLAIGVKDKHYYNFGGSYPITPIDIFSITLYNNLQKFSHLVLLNYERNIRQDWYIETSFYNGIGKDNSEFGPYPQVISLGLKNYF